MTPKSKYETWDETIERLERESMKAKLAKFKERMKKILEARK